MNGIIIDGKVYEAIPKGSYHCSDCSLFEQCKKDPANYGRLCISNILEDNVIFRFSQSLTDKINEK